MSGLENGKKLEAMFPIYEDAASETGRLKLRFRTLALSLLEAQSAADSESAKRSFSLALTDLETACMYAVKAIHQEGKR